MFHYTVTTTKNAKQAISDLEAVLKELKFGIVSSAHFQIGG